MFTLVGDGTRHCAINQQPTLRALRSISAKSDCDALTAHSLVAFNSFIVDPTWARYM